MAAMPQTSEELAEFIADDKKRESVFNPSATPGAVSEFLSAHAALHKKNDPGVGAQTDEQMKATFAQLIKDANLEGFGVGGRPAVGANMKASIVSARSAAGYNANTPGAKLDDMFKSPSEYFKAIHYDPNVNDPEKRQAIKNAMSSTTGADGGYLIPEVLRSELLQVALETAVVRPRARVIPMETLRVSFPSVDSTSNVGSVYGGITAFWTEEGAALQNVSPSFGRVTLEAKKLTVYTEVPNELQMDSGISFDALISQMYPEAISWYEDVAFLGGTGVGEPLGALNSANNAIVANAAETGQATATIVWENIVRMYSRMLPSALARAVWIASIDTFPQLATMALSVGTGGSAVWLGDGDGKSVPPVTILGRPVLFTEKTSVLGTQGDLSFVDFGHYLVGDRQSMSAMSSPHYKFGNDVTAYRVIERVDGRPWLQSAITPKNGGPTLSAYVQLATR